MATPATVRQLWEPIDTDALVRAALTDAIRAKKANYNDRIDELAAYLDGNHESVTDAEIATYFEQVDEHHGDYIRREYVPLARYLVDKMAHWLARPPRIWLTDDKGIPVSRTNPSSVHLDAMVNDTNLAELLHQGERWQAGFWTAFWQVAYREGEVVFDLYRPSQLEIYESTVDPRYLRWAQAILINNYRPNWAPAEDDNYSSADSYTVWTRQRIEGELVWGAFQVERGGGDAAEEATYQDPAEFVFPDGVNEYGEFPVVRWCERPPTDGVFVDFDDTLLRVQKNVDIIFTDIGEIVSFDSFGMKFVKGHEANRFETPHTPRAIHFIEDPDGEIGIVGPQAKIQEILQYLNNWLRYQAVVRDLPAQLFDLDTPNIQTGAAVARGRIHLRDARETRREPMRRNLVKLLEKGRVVWNYHNDTAKIDPNLKINVGFQGEDAMDPASRQSEAQARKAEYESGERSPRDDWLRRHHIDPDTATPEEKRLAEREVVRDAGLLASIRTAVPARQFRREREAEERGEPPPGQQPPPAEPDE